MGMEEGLPLYHWYFQRKWRHSLERKRELFPERHNYDDETLAKSVRELTRWMVERHTDFGTIDDYFDGYSIAGDRLAALAVPADILMAAGRSGDPVRRFPGAGSCRRMRTWKPRAGAGTAASSRTRPATVSASAG